MKPLSGLLLVATILLVCGCRAGVDPERLHGSWVNTRESIHFDAEGHVLWHAPSGVVIEGRYAAVSRTHIEVDLGSRWVSGEPKVFYALVRGEQVALCERPNFRHCMQYHRPGAAVRLVPR
jgi:hypothetical protein